MKIFPRVAKLFHEDRRTDMTKLIVAFRNFPKTPKNYSQEVRSWRKEEACLQSCGYLRYSSEAMWRN